MSTHMLCKTNIVDVQECPNSHSLDLIKVFDWQVVATKGLYKVGQEVIYVPVDSLLSQELEDKVFGPESKIKLHKHRVKSIKIRSQLSQGMILSLDQFDYDYIQQNVTKYEPPVRELPANMQIKKSVKKGNPNFKKYTDLNNFKYYPSLFKPGEDVYVSEKLHGTNFRAGWLLNDANTLWKKVLKLFGFLPQWEFCWGSRNVQIQIKGEHQGFKSEEQGCDFGDVYTRIVHEYDLKNKIPKGYTVFGEIVGHGVQKNYSYGCGPNEYKFYMFDVMLDGKYLPYKDFKFLAQDMHLETVPELFVGPFSKDIVDSLRTGDSLVGGQKVREGIVVKSAIEEDSSLGRKILKYINDDYYLAKNNSDFH